jgi:hypothetical protein
VRILYAGGKLVVLDGSGNAIPGVRSVSFVADATSGKPARFLLEVEDRGLLVEADATIGPHDDDDDEEPRERPRPEVLDE